MTYIIKQKVVSVKKRLKGFVVTKLTPHAIHCTKQIHRFIRKYKRFEKVTLKLKVYNCTDKPVTVGTKVVLGYVGRKISPTKSHIIIEQDERSNK